MKYQLSVLHYFFDNGRIRIKFSRVLLLGYHKIFRDKCAALKSGWMKVYYESEVVKESVDR